MRVQVTKTFAKELNKRVKGNYCIDYISYELIPYYMVHATVGRYDDEDLDLENMGVKCLKIVYKPECYAPARYISTSDLTRVCRYMETPTIEDYVTEFLNEYCI